MRIAIIGAGLTGLTAARALTDAGHAPHIYDKGRGLGGRLATRRTEGGLRFDHGCQYLAPKSPDFATFLDDVVTAGAAQTWALDDDRDVFVGTPGMSAVAKHLALGLEIRQGVEVSAIEQVEGGWRVSGELYDRVICTTPAPQAQRLIEHPVTKALQNVVMTPNLTLMVAFPEGHTRPFVTRRAPEDEIAWLALNSAKHGEAGPDCWVAQASFDWSKAHLELERREIADLMLPLVAKSLGADPNAAIYVAGHRWRYAQAAEPLGQPYLSTDGLYIGGDWALSARAEGAWLSGRAMAEAVLAS